MSGSTSRRSPGSTPPADRFLESQPGGDVSRFYDAPTTDVPVDGGTIRVRRIAGTGSGRPVIFVPGWGRIPESFDDFYLAVSSEVEIFHVETREKSSSRVDRSMSRFDIDQFALDVRAVIDHLKLADRDPILMGTCFGASVILTGLAHGTLDARTVLCLDPAEKSWLPASVIMALAPLPVFLMNLLRPVLRTIVLAGMHEPEQRARAAATINSAVIWKWRKSAIRMRKWNLFDHLSQIRNKTYVLNGSHDRFHDSAVFPAVADAIPDGVFIRVPVAEDRRERLFGAIATVFASTDSGPEIPPALREFVVPLNPDGTNRTGWVRSSP
jgi:pimeloyl-ACP methyl ester carboxylesterase